VVVAMRVVVVVVAGAVVVDAVAVVVVDDSRIVDDEDTAVDPVVGSTAVSGDPLHPERTTRTPSTSQTIQHMGHLPMLIFAHCHCLPGARRSQQNATENHA
jgi:hypothetical protein